MKKTTNRFEANPGQLVFKSLKKFLDLSKRIYVVALIISLSGILSLSNFSFFEIKEAKADTTTGLLAHWEFEEGTGVSTTDSSSNSHTGTLTNGPTWVAGRIGDGAVSFDGVDDSVSVLNGSTLNSNTCTISSWINGSSSFSGTVYRLSNSSSDTSNRSKYEIRITPTGITFRTGDGSSVVDDDVFNTTLTAGEWWHIACTLDGGNVKTCYKNGALISTSTNSADISLNISTLALIATNRSTIGMYNYYEGLIDDIRIYDRALSAHDIQELFSSYDTEAPSMPTNLASNSSINQVNLSWDASTDNIDVAGYSIYRDGVGIASTTVTSYSDTNVTVNTAYTYRVSAYDIVGNKSNLSNSLITTTSPGSFEVKSGGDGDYVTISDCVSTAKAGDECIVFAGTYNEILTPIASGTYIYPITIIANTGDEVNLDEVNFDHVDNVHIKDINVKTVTQHNISWTFDTYYQVGLFANEDWWVLGPVTIASMTPAYAGGENGWQVNPLVSGTHGFDHNCLLGGFDAALVPALPYITSATVESIVKTRSNIDQFYRVCLQTAAVLTAVSFVPENNGETIFRPPYVGTSSKPFYRTTDLRMDLLPSLAGVGTYPSLYSVQKEFEYLRMEHVTSAVRLDLRPLDAYGGNHDGYSPDFIIMNHEALLRLILNDSVQDKMPALIAVTQHSIDQTHMAIDGWDSSSADGHDPGHRIFMGFAATMLDITAAKTALLNANHMHEDYYINNINGNMLFGDRPIYEASYWGYLYSEEGSRSYRDPYGFIDGGTIALGLSSYQNIISQSWKGTTLMATLMPVIYQTAWPTQYWNPLKIYSERFVNIGTWAQPDPCAPVIKKTITGIATGNPTVLTSVGHGMSNGDSVKLYFFTGASSTVVNTQTVVIQNVTADTLEIPLNTIGLDIDVQASTVAVPYYGMQYGPDPSNPGMCILDTDLEYYNSSTDFACQVGHECGRFPNSQGLGVDGGQNRSEFVASMWDAYYDIYSSTTSSPLVITFTSTSTTATTATINFTTAYVATSTIYYGEDANYGTASTSNISTTSHSITLHNLTEYTGYHFYIEATNATGTATSSDYTFTTDDATNPTVTGFDIDATSSSLTVNINTFTASTTGGSPIAGYLVTETSTAPAVDNGDWTDSVWSVFTFLTDGAKTLYAWVKDLYDNISTATVSDTVTIDIWGPEFSNIASSTDTTTATITFTTNENATSSVSYGLTTSYNLASSSDILASTTHTIN
ncbi:MAG: LamG-like jellyroll fold domain-containing protein, partial [Patescibacteria group bacterium]